MQGFNGPLTQMYCSTGAAVASLAGDAQQLTLAIESLRLMSRVFFSLNWQDLPAFFEDNISVWMTEFAKLLTYKNPLLESRSQDDPGPLELLQSAVIENINLYATKYEEEFAHYLPQFTQIIWQCLVDVPAASKFDVLATGGIKFLSAVCTKEMNKNLFSDDVLRMLVEQIVVRNLTSSESDEELFEDNPQV
jgi:exportin-2 (importin alpha re-exporter)